MFFFFEKITFFHEKNFDISMLNKKAMNQRPIEFSLKLFFSIEALNPKKKELDFDLFKKSEYSYYSSMFVLRKK